MVATGTISTQGLTRRLGQARGPNPTVRRSTGALRAGATVDLSALPGMRSSAKQA